MAEYTKEQLENMQLASELREESIEKLYDGKLKEAKDIATRARDIFKEVGNRRELAASLNTLSIIYDEMGNASKSLELLLDGLEIALDENAFDVAAKLYNNMASNLMYIKAYDRATYYFVQTVEMIEKAKELNQFVEADSAIFMLVLNLNLSLVYCVNNELDKAREYFEKSKVLSTHPDNKELLLTYNAFEMLILWRLGDSEAAKACVDSLLDNIRATEYSANYLEIMSYVFEVLRDMKEYSKWEKALQIMDGYVTDDVELYVRIEIIKHWLEFYEETNNREGYARACISFYKLSKAKEEEDQKKAADTIELEAELRRQTREKKKTDKIVYLDALTGISNRNKMIKDSKAYIERSAKDRLSISIGLIDIDYFKECNDTYGHVDGDNCLKRVAQVISDAVGEQGTVYRYGGDEFLIIMTEAKSSTLIELGERIKTNLEKEQIPNRKSPISDYVTVSQGYTTAWADEGDNLDTLIKLADRVLYHIKRNGRNDYKFMSFNDILTELSRKSL